MPLVVHILPQPNIHKDNQFEGVNPGRCNLAEAVNPLLYNPTFFPPCPLEDNEAREHKNLQENPNLGFLNEKPCMPEDWNVLFHAQKSRRKLLQPPHENNPATNIYQRELRNLHIPNLVLYEYRLYLKPQNSKSLR